MSVTTADAAMPLVMVAEDNDDNRYIAVTMLRHVGYRVLEAETGSSAIALARSERPALILMDVGMPDTDGLTATRTLKDDTSTRGIVILAFTAHALPRDVRMAREAGCDGYIAKPVAPSRLVSDVAAALRGTYSWPPS